jgi:hypothetical protein
MALMKSIEVNDTGVAAAYWRLTHLQIDRIAGVVEATLHGYRDAEARKLGRQPLSRAQFRFATTEFGEAELPGIEEIYTAIRDQPTGRDEAGQALPALFADASNV